MGFISFDWGKEWNGDDLAVSLSRRERAMLLLSATNIYNNIALFVRNYTDVNEVSDFLNGLLYKLMSGIIVSPESAYQENVFMLAKFIPTFPSSSGFGAITRNSSQDLGFYAEPSLPQSTNQWYVPCRLRAGEYYMRTSYVRQLNSGILTTQYVDNDDVVTNLDTIDMHGSFLLNQDYFDQFTIGESGCKYIKLSTPTKNAASSSYRVALTCISIFRLKD